MVYKLRGSEYLIKFIDLYYYTYYQYHFSSIKKKRFKLTKKNIQKSCLILNRSIKGIAY